MLQSDPSMKLDPHFNASKIGTHRRILTADIDVHNCSVVLVICSNSFAIVTVPQADSTALAGGKKEIAVFIIFHASERPIMTLEQNWTHSSAHVACKENADSFLGCSGHAMFCSQHSFGRRKRLVLQSFINAANVSSFMNHQSCMMDSFDGKTRNSIIRLIESQLKTKFCPEYVHMSTQVFEDTKKYELKPDSYYTWPPERLHRNARDTHHLLRTRYPVPDENVRGDSMESYQPCWAKESDESDSTAHPNSEPNPQGRLGPYFISCLVM